MKLYPCFCLPLLTLCFSVNAKDVLVPNHYAQTTDRDSSATAAKTPDQHKHTWQNKQRSILKIQTVTKKPFSYNFKDSSLDEKKVQINLNFTF